MGDCSLADAVVKSAGGLERERGRPKGWCRGTGIEA